MNKRSVEMLAAVAAEDITLVEYMLKVLQDENTEDKLRQWAAEKIALYIHPKPQPVARPINIELPRHEHSGGRHRSVERHHLAVAFGDIKAAEAQGLVSIVESQRNTVEPGEIVQRIAELQAALEQRGAA